MSAAKTATLTMRINPGVKKGLRIISEQEHRSLANMNEVIIREYCGRHGVTVPEKGELWERQ